MDSLGIELLELFMRNNEAFLQQLTIIISFVGLMVVIISIGIPIYQNNSNKTKLKEIEERLGFLEKDIENKFSNTKIELDKAVSSTKLFMAKQKEEILALPRLYEDEDWRNLQQDNDKLSQIAKCEKLLINYPQNEIEIKRQLASIYLFGNVDREFAKEILKEILEKDNTSHYTHFMLAKAYEETKEFSLAEKHYKLSSNANKYNAPYWAGMYLRVGDYQKMLDNNFDKKGLIYQNGNTQNKYDAGLFLVSVSYLFLEDLENAKMFLTKSNVQIEDVNIQLEMVNLDLKRQEKVIDFAKDNLQNI
ncbi:MAG: hypothetical protein FWG63_02545 [Defluviitaleaceae bacterium]|nr:hypothetical protein [Defluviitaleaceae bacterium]